MKFWSELFSNLIKDSRRAIGGSIILARDSSSLGGPEVYFGILQPEI